MLLIPLIILGGIFTGVFTPTESGAVAAAVAIAMALFGYASLGAAPAAGRADRWPASRPGS